MSYDRYTKQYLDFLDKFGDKINRMSNWSLDEIVDFIQSNGPGSGVVTDLLFAIGLMKAPEKILIERRSRPTRAACLILKVHDLTRYGFIWADLQKGKIDDKAVREALLSKDRICGLRVPGVILAAEEMIRSCKIERG